MKFTYFKKTGEYHRGVQYHDGAIDVEYDGDAGYDFEYEVDDSDVKNALAQIISRNYSFDYNKTLDLIVDCDLVDTLSEIYEDELSSYFESEALEGV